MPVEVSDERRGELLKLIQAFFAEHLDDDIGDLKARLVLDFFMKQMAPLVYNQALNDAAAFMQDKAVDLEGELFVEVED